jgi:hypothetical protein
MPVAAFVSLHCVFDGAYLFFGVEAAFFRLEIVVYKRTFNERFQ